MRDILQAATFKQTIYSAAYALFYRCLALQTFTYKYLVAAAFKQRCTALLLHCFVVVKHYNLYAAHDFQLRMLDRLTSVALETLKRCATQKMK